MIAIVELHLRSAMKHKFGDKETVDAWIPKMASTMLEAFRSFSSKGMEWTARDLAAWADAFELYPKPENDSEAIQHTVDAGRRLFSARCREHTKHFLPNRTLTSFLIHKFLLCVKYDFIVMNIFLLRLTPKDRSRLESTIISRFPEAKGAGDDVYAWKGNSAGGLLPYGPEQWRQEVENTVAKCVREGYQVRTEMTSQFLQLVAGKKSIRHKSESSGCPHISLSLASS